MNRNSSGFAVALLLAFLSSPAMIFAQDRANSADVNRATARRSPVLGPDDTITIVALNCDEISKAWRIGATGDVNLPMIGRVHFQGLTVEESERTLSDRLQKYVKDPQVSVFMSDQRSQPVTVTGAVEKPGKHQLEGSKTLFDVLVLAGGPKDAGPTVTVKRTVTNGRIEWQGARTDKDDTYTMVDLDLKAVMAGKGDAAAFLVKPDDIVTVAPVRATRFVHISGEVNRPGSIEMLTQERVSLMKVIAMAGGITHTAAPNRTMIMHINSDGLQTSTAFVDVRKILNGKAKDLELSYGDVVIVPSSQLKTYMQTASMSAVTTGVYSAVYILGRL